MDGVRRPEAFQAVIGGQAESAVAAERHFSPAKVNDTQGTGKPAAFISFENLQSMKDTEDYTSCSFKDFKAEGMRRLPFFANSTKASCRWIDGHQNGFDTSLHCPEDLRKYTVADNKGQDWQRQLSKLPSIGNASSLCIEYCMTQLSIKKSCRRSK